jgi:ABC-type antimicrobial peptide transport system permease subunit
MNTRRVLNSAPQVTFAMPSIAEITAMGGIALVVVIFIGRISSVWQAYRSSSMNPYEAIRNEGQ